MQELSLRIQIIQTKRLHKRKLIELKNKHTLNCVFFVVYSSTWKYDRIYQIMLKNRRFNPTILVCPVVNYGKEVMLRNLDECYNFYFQKGYNVIKSYNSENDIYYDPRDLKPDVIFYTNPYKGLIDDRYFITNFNDILTVYVPYFMNTSIDKWFSCNLPLHNLVWRKYVETDYEYKLAQKEQDRHGENVVVTGYPGIECLIDPNYNPQNNPWKLETPKLKKIIWAPHHTIKKGNREYSCFLAYCDFMLEMVKKYKNEVQFVFKPHPLLRSKLELLWGKEKTDSYFKKWQDLPNTALHETDYIDIFLTSDAMIHDSGSFIVEYLYVNKPVMRTIKDQSPSEHMNDFGLSCLDQYYLAYTKDDIEQFIQNVINGVDPLKEQRTKFVNEVLMPKGSPSQNIIDDILDSIDNQILYRN